MGSSVSPLAVLGPASRGDRSAVAGLPRSGAGSSDRPLSDQFSSAVDTVCVRDPPGPSRHDDRGRSLAPGPTRPQLVTDVRQRVQREQTGRRGNLSDPKRTNRRLLLSAGDRLSPRALDRLIATLHADDPTDEIGAACRVNELLRQLLAANGPTRYSRHEVADRRTRFYAACIDRQVPEISRLAAMIATWWVSEIEAFLRTGITKRTDRGLQPSHQVDQAGRPRVSQPDQPRGAHHAPYGGSTGRVNTSSRRRTQTVIEQPGYPPAPAASINPTAAVSRGGVPEPGNRHDPPSGIS